MDFETLRAARSVAGRTVLITGAASGMGRACAELFAAEGAKVAVTDWNGEGAEDVAEAIREAGGEAQAWTLDVSDPQAIQAVIAEAAVRFGRLDILVNNAGVSAFKAIDAEDYETVWDRALAILLTAHQRTVRAALPHLRRSDAGRIVNVASTEGLGAMAQDSPYVAAKTGVVGLTRALAVELGPEGITVNCVCPGPIDTAMTAPVSPEHKATFARRRTALHRYGRPDEVAQVILSLCLPAAGYITGAIVPVDGGLSARSG